MLAVVLVTLAKYVANLNSGLRSIPKRTTNLMVWSNGIVKQHVFTCITIFSLKIIDKINSKFRLKIKEALYINWKTKSFSPHPLTIILQSLLCSFLSVLLLLLFHHFLSSSSNYMISICSLQWSSLYRYYQVYTNQLTSERS